MDGDHSLILSSCDIAADNHDWDAVPAFGRISAGWERAEQWWRLCYQLLTISLWLGSLLLICDWNYVQFVHLLTSELKLMRHWFQKGAEKEKWMFCWGQTQRAKTRETSSISFTQVRNIALGQTQTSFRCQNILHKWLLPVCNKIIQIWRSGDKY